MFLHYIRCMKKSKFKLRDYQEPIRNEILSALKTKKRVLACANCGLGKTAIGLSIANHYANKGLRVAIVTYSRNEIKEHWLQENDLHKIISWDKIQVVNGLGNAVIPSVKVVKTDQIDKKMTITLFIPQSLSSNPSALGNIDLFIVDEAHEYLEVGDNEENEGLLLRIIKNSPKAKILGLTGSGHELVDGNIFNKTDDDVEILVYDTGYAFKYDAILPVEIDISYFKFDLTPACFDSKGDLNKTGRKVVKANACRNKKIEDIISTYCSNNQKTLVIVPSGDEIYQEAYEYINQLHPGQVVVKTSHASPEENQEAENQFRNNDNVNFMIVISMCNIGWNFDRLENVIDLTFTRNEKVVIQRLSRLCRKYPNKKPNYVYCADQSKNPDLIQTFISTVLERMTKFGILNPEINEIAFRTDEKEERDLAYQNGGRILFGSVLDYFNTKKVLATVQNSQISTHVLLRVYNDKNIGHRFLVLVWKALSERSTSGVMKGCSKKIKQLEEELVKHNEIFPSNSDAFIRKTAESVNKLFGLDAATLHELASLAEDKAS
jgi:superfamily II DNA or RNA helicase